MRGPASMRCFLLGNGGALLLCGELHPSQVWIRTGWTDCLVGSSDLGGGGSSRSSKDYERCLQRGLGRKFLSNGWPSC